MESEPNILNNRGKGIVESELNNPNGGEGLTAFLVLKIKYYAVFDAGGLHGVVGHDEDVLGEQGLA